MVGSWMIHPGRKTQYEKEGGKKKLPSLFIFNVIFKHRVPRWIDSKFQIPSIGLHENKLCDHST